ncbi:MAG: surface-adhesin E family protein [Brevundimonas sp.]|uniref:surface-adhesin E family protein n=1 Tax=Brevundimonas sp. TaxID=1871086 RepID=UPI00300380DB
MRLALALAAGTLAAASFGISAAQAQSAPPASAPYYIVDAGDSALAIASGGSLRKSGNIASMTVVMGAHPDQVAESGIARLDMAYEFNCANSTYRTPGAAAYDVDGGFMGAIDDDEPWQPVAPDSNNATFKAIACDGVIPEDSEVGDNLTDIIAVYREWILEQ